MAFDFSKPENAVRLFGTWPQVPYPLEVSIYSLCSLSCGYCVSADSPVMLDTLRCKPGGDVKVGDSLLGWGRYGTVESRCDGGRGFSALTRTWTRSVVTEVMHRRAPVVRLELEGGSSVVCTPDHHWFTGRSGRLEYMPPGTADWRALHRLDIPLLLEESFSADYMVGYVRGIAAGDGTWMPQATWRIALKDPEPLARVASFLFALGLGQFDARPFDTPDMQQLVFPIDSPANAMINGFDIPSLEYVHGWLAGIYDAEGTTPGGRLANALRICQCQKLNPLTYDRVKTFLRHCGFGYVAEEEAVRLCGGKLEMARFTQLVRPATPRKINPLLDGGIKGAVSTRKVIAIVPAGEVDVASFTTTTHNYVTSGLLSRNCFSNLNRSANDREPNPENPTARVIARLDRALRSEYDPVGFMLRRKYPVCFSNSTDPFQRQEKTYRSSETFMKWALANDIPLWVQTKGGVLLEEFGRYAPLLVPGKDVVYLSVTHSDDRTRKRIEPGATPIHGRWELARKLSDAGVPVVAAPNPYLKDWIPDRDEYCARAKESGCRGLWVADLHFNASQKEVLAKPYQSLTLKADLQPFYAAPSMLKWYEAAERHGLDCFATPYWDAWFLDRSRHPECLDPSWVNHNPFDFAFQLLRAVAQTSRECGDCPVLFSWPDLRAFLEATDFPNPVLDTAAFWKPYYCGRMKGDYKCWVAALGRRAPLLEILRYYFNHPWECQNFVWYHPRVRALFDQTRNLYVADSEGDLVAVYDPSTPLGAPFTLDAGSVDWDRALWWDVGAVLSPTTEEYALDLSPDFGEDEAMTES